MNSFNLTPVVDLCPGAEVLTKALGPIVLREVETENNLVTVLGHDPFTDLVFARAFRLDETVYARNLK